LKDSIGGDGGVRVVGHSSAMDAQSTTSVASAIALSDKDVPCEAIALSTNHTPYQAQIGNLGGAVRYNHWIIRGGFGVSRACGVQQLEQYLVTKPEIHEVTIEEGVYFLVLATAGLWSVVSNHDAVSMVQSIPDVEEAANRLVEEAHRKGSPDNVTCVIVHFHHDA
jgi:protein phosphatase 1L